MATRTLKTFPADEKFLRTKSEPVDLQLTETEAGELAILPEDVVTLINDMYETLFAYRAAGLSAVQVGEHKRVIVFLQPNDEPYALINPVIAEEPGEGEVISSMEGCLSFPGVHEAIQKTRIGEVTVSGINEHGEYVTLVLTDQQAIAVQHEVDHLDGVLFIDRMGPTARRLALKRIQKVQRRIEHAQENFNKQMSRRGRVRAA